MFGLLQWGKEDKSSSKPMKDDQFLASLRVSVDSSNLFTSLLGLSFDPFYKDGFENTSSSPKSVPDKIKDLNLDITRISDRLIVGGTCWKNRTEKMSHRNNIHELALFLNTRYLAWNLSSENNYDTQPLNNQVIFFDLNRILNLTIPTIFDICRSICSWLLCNPDNVCFLHCTNGISRTGLIIACLFKFCDLFESIFDAFDYFIRRRTPNDSSWVTISQLRLLKYFDHIMVLHGSVPNPFPMKMHRLIMNTVPRFNEDNSCDPGVEIYQNGMLVYSSMVQIAEAQLKAMQMKSKGSDDSMNELVIFKDENNVLFRLEDVILEGDIHVRIFHFNEMSHQNVTMVSLSFNTGFMMPGLIRFHPRDLELRDSIDNSRFHPDFCLDMALSQSDSSQFLSYQQYLDHSSAANFSILSEHHIGKSDVNLIKALELQGYIKLVAKLALQLTNNSIHEAHEFMTKFSNSSLYKSIAQDLVEKGRNRYQKIKQFNHNRRKSLSAVTESKESNMDIGQRLQRYRIKSIEHEQTGLILEIGSLDKKVATPTIVTPTVSVASQVSPDRLYSPIVSSALKELNENKNDDLPLNENTNSIPQDSSIPPPPPFPGIPPPPPLGLPFGVPPPPQMGNPSAVKKKRVKNALHWDEIHDKSSIRNSIWLELVNEDKQMAGLSLDVKQFEELFVVSAESEQAAAKELKNKKKEAPKTVSLLDSRRSNNINIGLAKFSKRFTDFELVQAMVSDSDSLNADDLLAISGLLPTPEEREKLSLYKGPLDKLGRAEQFLFVVMKEPQLQWICDQLIFKRTFDDSFNAINLKFSEMKELLDKLRSSESLKVLLGTVLELGNLTNYDYGRGFRSNSKAVGFKVDSLIKLQDVKGKDGKTSLLNFLVSVADKNDKMVLLLPEQFSELGQLRHYNTNLLWEEYRDFLNSFDSLQSNSDPSTVEFKNLLHPFMLESSAKVEQLKLLSNEFDKSWEKTAAYFGEDDGEKSPEELFNALHRFFQAFGEAIRQNEASSSKKKKRAKTTGSSSHAPKPRRPPHQKDKDSIHGFALDDLLEHQYFKRKSEGSISRSQSFVTNDSLERSDSQISTDKCTFCSNFVDDCVCQY